MLSCKYPSYTETFLTRFSYPAPGTNLYSYLIQKPVTVAAKRFEALENARYLEYKQCLSCPSGLFYHPQTPRLKQRKCGDNLGTAAIRSVGFNERRCDPSSLLLMTPIFLLTLAGISLHTRYGTGRAVRRLWRCVHGHAGYKIGVASSDTRDRASNQRRIANDRAGYWRGIRRLCRNRRCGIRSRRRRWPYHWSDWIRRWGWRNRIR